MKKNNNKTNYKNSVNSDLFCRSIQNTNTNKKDRIQASYIYLERILFSSKSGAEPNFKKDGFQVGVPRETKECLDIVYSFFLSILHMEDKISNKKGVPTPFILWICHCFGNLCLLTCFATEISITGKIRGNGGEFRVGKNVTDGFVSISKL